MKKTSTATSLDAHVKDCVMFRKELKRERAVDKRERAVDRKEQKRMHDENSERADKAEHYRAGISRKIDDLCVNVSDLSGHVTTLKNKEAKDKERRQKMGSVAQRALIGLLMTALAYALWHIITTKGLGP